MTFFNRYGKPIAYSDDNVNIFAFNGQPLAYIFDDKVYAFNGRHLGWFWDGWIRDSQGYCVFFNEYATGGPLKPLKRLLPLKGLKRLLPLKGLRRMAGFRPIKRLAWSNYSDLEFFEQ